MTDPTITDLRRELEKARLALIDAQSHLAAHAEANAALHCATTVMYSPLHAKVTAAIAQIGHALDRTVPTADRAEDHVARLLAGVIADLDRCMHGRHSADPCGSCGGQSKGNHHLTPGTVIGYDVHANPIYVPVPANRYKPEAWRTRPVDTTGDPR